jgi:hypothetical protein
MNISILFFIYSLETLNDIMHFAGHAMRTRKELEVDHL